MESLRKIDRKQEEKDNSNDEQVRESYAKLMESLNGKQINLKKSSLTMNSTSEERKIGSDSTAFRNLKANIASSIPSNNQTNSSFMQQLLNLKPSSGVNQNLQNSNNENVDEEESSNSYTR